MLNGFTETSPHAYASPSNELHYNESRARYIIEINNSCRNVRQFCSIISTLSVTEIAVQRVYARFSAGFAPVN